MEAGFTGLPGCISNEFLGPADALGLCLYFENRWTRVSFLDFMTQKLGCLKLPSELFCNPLCPIGAENMYVKLIT